MVGTLSVLAVSIVALLTTGVAAVATGRRRLGAGITAVGFATAAAWSALNVARAGDASATSTELHLSMGTMAVAAAVYFGYLAAADRRLDAP